MTVRGDTRLRAGTVLLLATALLGACTSTGSGTSTQPSAAPVGVAPASPTASAAGHHVQMVVTTPSTKTLDIAYGIGAGDLHKVSGVTSPWTVQQDTPAHVALFGVAATVDGNPLPVTCVLVFDGKVVHQHTDSGAVGCQYVPPVSAG
jgi:ABC-type Fe3+-hydroxamate transport system substrate-binding protein